MVFKEYLKEVLLCIIIILLIGLYGFIWYINFYDKKENKEILISEPVSEITPEQETESYNQYVEVKGAVKRPGVFAIIKGTIVNDVINQAGGFANNAYTSNINLSKKLNDETVIYVYTKTEYSNLNKEDVKEVIIEKECVCPEVDISSCIESGSSIIEKEESNEIIKDESETDDPKEGINNLININVATKEQLMSLNGIGEAKAESIINYRVENGLFNSIEDIKEVSGISDAIYEKIKDFITT